ncbi:MAG TPA: amino acid permease, partial [Flavobacteriales bacterium]|nr:amino acid permease [Flavobacteriales bacterium]
MRTDTPVHPRKLGQLPATAICGNDITSSCLYVSALTIGYAGPWAFVALLLVAGVLFLYRRIYGEVVGALPLNGGAYNVLLNTTNKTNASIAACLTIL